ncbi:MAG: hypothetical protein PVJ92_01140 [Candidatus Dependentiae bacterium]|jgi:AAA family ATP:ADP antiporter
MVKRLCILLSAFDLRKHSLLAALFFLIIGSFWLLGSLQEPIFYHLVGRYHHPQVNIIAFLPIIPLMFGYLAALQRWGPMPVFVGASLGYAAFFTGAAFLLQHPTIGLANTQPEATRLLGWLIYAIIKTYGSFLVTLFWTFATSITTVEEAKMTFPAIFAIAQLGSLSGSHLACYALQWGIPLLIYGAAASMLLMALLFYVIHRYYMPVRPTRTPASVAELFSGARLLLQRPHLRRIFVVSTAFLVITTFYDYQMHALAHAAYPTVEQFAWFKGMYGKVVNGFTLVFALGGTQLLLRLFGVHWCLLLYPVLTAGAVLMMWQWPTLLVVTAGMVLLRGLSFALNSPAKEILYIPESPQVRFKVKSWIDMIGYRFVWALGSGVTELIKEPVSFAITASGVMSLGVLAVWLPCAWSLESQSKEKS